MFRPRELFPEPGYNYRSKTPLTPHITPSLGLHLFSDTDYLICTNTLNQAVAEVGTEDDQ